jgi:hypothetical protein
MVTDRIIGGRPFSIMKPFMITPNGDSRNDH